MIHSWKELAAALTGGEAFLPAQQLQEKHEVGLGIDGEGWFDSFCFLFLLGWGCWIFVAGVKHKILTRPLDSRHPIMAV